MSRISNETGAVIARHLLLQPDRYPFLNIDSMLLGVPEIEGIVVAEAVDRALAGLDNAQLDACAYLEKVPEGVMDVDSFRILAMSDIHPLVAIALAIAYSGGNHFDEQGLYIKVDADLPGIRSTLIDYEHYPKTMISVDYTLSDDASWTSWQRSIRYHWQKLAKMPPKEQIGQRLSSIISHRATDGLDFTIASIDGEDMRISGDSQWTTISKLPKLYAALQSEGRTRYPAPPLLHHEEALSFRILELVEQTENHAIRLRMAAQRLGFH